jgi:hypothetical protein
LLLRVAAVGVLGQVVVAVLEGIGVTFLGKTLVVGRLLSLLLG